MRNIEVTAKTVDLAIEKGLQMLGVKKEQVSINVLEKETMLKKAKIEMVLYDNEQEKEEALKELKNKPQKKNNYERVKPNAVIEEKEEIRETLTDEEKAVSKTINEFLIGLNEIININATITYKMINNDMMVSIDGDTSGLLIGHHGDNLDALQNIVNGIIKNKHDDVTYKIFVDVEGYRKRRQDTLIELAGRMASKVIKVERSLKLEPMNSYERRIIHTALQGIDHITTHSEGMEPNRFLVIDYVK